MLHGAERGPRSVMVESLECRRFLCGTATSVSSAAGTATPALVAKAAILGPSAVVGTYRGSAVITGTTTSIPLKAVIRSTSATLTVTGYGTVTVPVTTKQFKKLRGGAFNVAATVDGVTVDLVGTVVKGGARITGTFGATGTIVAAGTFLLKKG